MALKKKFNPTKKAPKGAFCYDRNMENIKWLFFDMGGVILDDDTPEGLRQADLLKIAEKYLPNSTIQDVKKAWEMASPNPGSMKHEAAKLLFANQSFAEQAVSEYLEYCQVDYYGLSRVRPEAKKVIPILAEKYNLGIMANQGAKAIDHLVEANLLGFFSHQKMSHHVGLQKPNPEFFNTILKDTGAKPEESIQIDDNWFRGCVPARKAGMKIVLYKRDIIPHPADANPDWEVSNLKELLEIF